MAEFHRRDSFLRNTDVYAGALDVNNLPVIPKNINDTSYKIDSKYNNRPDLLAYEIYENSYLWWVFLLRNPDILKDPIRDFRTGVIIRIPSRGVVEEILR